MVTLLEYLKVISSCVGAGERRGWQTAAAESQPLFMMAVDVCFMLVN